MFSITIIGTNLNFRRILAEIIGTEVPVNEAFDDINFYKCVVDAYNLNADTNKEYTDNLTDEELQGITSLKYNTGGGDRKISSAKGIEKLKSLTSLDL